MLHESLLPCEVQTQYQSILIVPLKIYHTLRKFTFHMQLEDLGAKLESISDNPTLINQTLSPQLSQVYFPYILYQTLFYAKWKSIKEGIPNKSEQMQILLKHE